MRPIFNELLDRWPSGEEWLSRLYEAARQTRPTAVTSRHGFGRLIPAETPSVRAGRLGTVFERTVAPPAKFLEWLLQHPERMQVTDAQTFGASSQDAQEWRRALFSPDTGQRERATAEGLKQLSQRGTEGSRHQWWAFEGFTHIDCCLVTDRGVIFIEGKRTETVSPSTRWFPKRNQLWRNVEVAQQFARGGEFGVILAVKEEADGKAALLEAQTTLSDSYPQLTAPEQQSLAERLLGFVTWPRLVAMFSLPLHCLPDTVSDVT